MPTLITTDQHLTTQCDRKILKGTVKGLKKKKDFIMCKVWVIIPLKIFSLLVKPI